MNAEQTREAIKVMQHFADGGRVQARSRHHPDDWEDWVPVWNWDACEYRIAREPVRTWVVLDRDDVPIDRTFHDQFTAEDFAERCNQEGPLHPYRVVEMVEATK